MSNQHLHYRLRRHHWIGRPCFEAGWTCQATVTDGEHVVGIWLRIGDGTIEQRAFRWNGRKWKPLVNMVRP